jgi:hypothetical protein
MNQKLLKGARRSGKYVVCVAANKANCAYHNYQNHGQHYCILSYVLSAIITQNTGERAHFDVTP